jgi:zinc transport system substrate-binding protein
LATAAVAGLAGCGTPANNQGSDKLQVMASFYPLAWVAQRVGGDQVEVTSLTPPGAEPHGAELSPKQAGALASADLVVTLGGFQAAVDQAVANQKPKHVVDAATLIDLQDGDPHFWLDPERLEVVVGGVGDALAQVDPAGADQYRDRAAQLISDLGQLDGELREGLGGYAAATLVTTHQAFRYFAERYELTQVAVAGIDPEAEPSPARMMQVKAQLEPLAVKTIFFEDQASPAVAKTLAGELGIATAVLSPVEIAPEEGDFLTAMRANLAALQKGLVKSP